MCEVSFTKLNVNVCRYVSCLVALISTFVEIHETPLQRRENPPLPLVARNSYLKDCFRLIMWAVRYPTYRQLYETSVCFDAHVSSPPPAISSLECFGCCVRWASGSSVSRLCCKGS